MKRLWIMILILTCITISTGTEKYRIAYAIPRTVNDMFFGPTVAFMQAAARSLGVELEVIEAGGNHIITERLIREAVTRKENPVDAVIALSAKENGVKFVKLCDSVQIPLLIENAAIMNTSIGAPREKFPYYIGEMLPDDELAGYLLAKYLIELQQKRVPGDTVNIVGINGPLSNGPAQARLHGLERAVTGFSDVNLLQVVNARWEPEIAEFMFKGLLSRYRVDGITVVWAASDGMALGALDAVPEGDTTLLFGGIDWSAEGVEALQSGILKATAGGQSFEAAWALIVMFDYLNGIDFAKSEGVRMRTEMKLLTTENINRYLPLLDEKNWDRINFRHFSKYYNRSIEKYNFEIETLSRMISEE